MRTDVSVTDRIGNGIIAGFVATLLMSMVHEPADLVAEAVGVDTPIAGLLFHFFVGTLLWGSLFGVVHDVLPGPSWLRGVIFSGSVALVIMLIISPWMGSGLLCLELGLFAPVVVTFFHLAYGAVLGVAYGKMIDTDEARGTIGHAQH